jgi:hypothetical protein
MGEAMFAHQPRCPEHGQMRYDQLMSRWECRGFDGERCPHVVTDEELSWTPLGAVEAIQWAEPFTVRGRAPGGGVR